MIYKSKVRKALCEKVCGPVDSKCENIQRLDAF